MIIFVKADESNCDTFLVFINLNPYVVNQANTTKEITITNIEHTLLQKAYAKYNNIDAATQQHICGKKTSSVIFATMNSSANPIYKKTTALIEEDPDPETIIFGNLELFGYNNCT